MILATKRTHRPHDGSAVHFVSAQREPDGLSNGKNKCQEVRQLSLPQTEYICNSCSGQRQTATFLTKQVFLSTSLQ